MPSLHRECWLPADLTLVAGGDSPSAVIDFSSIFSSFVSSSTAVFSISCFFSGLAVLAILQDKNQRVTKVEKLLPFQGLLVVQHTAWEQSAGWHLHSEFSFHSSGSTLSSSAGKGRGSDVFLYSVLYFVAFSMACVCVCVCANAYFRSVSRDNFIPQWWQEHGTFSTQLHCLQRFCPSLHP